MVAGRGFAARKVARKHGWHAQGAVVRGLACASLLCSGCSPTAFAVRQRAAARAVAAAEAAGAQTHATYEIVLARRYLDKAREESGEAHYAWALELLAKSERSAARASALSEPVAGTVQGNLR